GTRGRSTCGHGALMPRRADGSRARRNERPSRPNDRDTYFRDDRAKERETKVSPGADARAKVHELVMPKQTDEAALRPVHKVSSTERDPLVIKDVTFLGGMAVAGGWRPPEGLPEIAFIGRSNVGKSSLLNLLVRRKSFARVSNTPGRTQEVNFFGVNGELVLVDLPGYGFAKVAKTKRHSWQPLIDGYLRMTNELRGIVLLLDIRRDPNEEDLAMLDYLATLDIPTLVAITKVDKLGAKEREARLEALVGMTGIDAEQMVPCSAHAHLGRDDLAAAVAALTAEPAWRREAEYEGEP
ncbi:MAG: ribosome biogenesis GTP-binding protein YihA/YsxC, partial [Gemmatimonadaceae bacterium]